MGKFLGNVQDLRAIQNWSGQGMLSALSSVGEGTYYFIDQFIWCVCTSLPTLVTFIVMVTVI